MTVPMAATINIFVDYAVTKHRATEGGSGKHLTRNHFIKAFNVKQASPPESGLEISVTNIILCFTIPDFQVTTKINKDSDGFLKKSFYVHPSHQYKMEVNKDVITWFIMFAVKDILVNGASNWEGYYPIGTHRKQTTI